MGFGSNEAAGACVADIIRAGVLPVAIEFMDRPCIRACEAFAHAGYPDVEALLIVEVEGAEAEIAEQLGKIDRDRRAPRPRGDPREPARPRKSALIWKGRKAAFGAMGQIADYICLDGTIPVSELPFVLRRIGELTASYGLGVANVFHAGDGNMHPLILYDANKPGRPREGRGARRRHPAALRRGRRLPDRRARRRRREARPDGRAVRARPTSRRSSGSRTSSTRAGCSTRPRCFRSRRAPAAGTRRERRREAGCGRLAPRPPTAGSRTKAAAPPRQGACVASASDGSARRSRAPSTPPSRRRVALCRREMAPSSSQRRTGGPKVGCSIVQRRSRGEPRPKAKAATIMNGTVGITGSASPTSPSAAATIPSPVHKPRTIPPPPEPGPDRA